MSERYNEEVCFSNSDGRSEASDAVSIGAGKKSKMFVCAAWTVHCGEPIDESTRSIPIQDLFKFLLNKDKYIAEEAKRISGAQMKMKDDRIKLLEDDGKERDKMIYQLSNKVAALKTALKEMRK